MSKIFDALQRSVAEDSQGAPQDSPFPIDVLEWNERRRANSATRAVLDQEPGVHDATVDTPKLPLATVKGIDEFPLPGDISENSDPPIDEFSQFRTLATSIPTPNQIVCVNDKESLAAEKFRFLAVRLRQLRQKRTLKKVLISSTIPQEGKSMVSSNLACALARRKPEKVLLVEGDLRRPSLTASLGLGKLTGLCECLQRKASIATSVYYLEAAGLWVLPAGSTPENPLELMQSALFPSIMEQLANWFNWIIIDSPPLLPLADTSIWMRAADGILLVTRQGVTEKKQLQRGLEVIERSKLLGTVLNGATRSSQSDYYYCRPGTPS